jgi:RNA polymerase sigma factor for flagellar operon FliA
MLSAWDDYRADRSVAQRNRLVLVYAPLVKWVVGRLPSQVRAHVEAEELIGYGMLGLIDAVERFDPEPGFKFETYAIRRIRGAIFDELRKLDWVPRGVRDQARAIDEARGQLEAVLRRSPTAAEVAERAGLSVDSVTTLLSELSLAAPLSLDGISPQTGRSLADALGGPDDAIEAVAERLDTAEMVRRLREAMGRLGERDGRILRLYYLEGMTLSQIGEVLGVTESRVSQLRAQALGRLRTLLGESGTERAEVATRV